MKDYRTKVIVTNKGGGWYNFSPTGHEYYNKNDEINVQGLQKCIKLLNEFNVKGYLNNKTPLN